MTVLKIHYLEGSLINDPLVHTQKLNLLKYGVEELLVHLTQDHYYSLDESKFFVPQGEWSLIDFMFPTTH